MAKDYYKNDDFVSSSDTDDTAGSDSDNEAGTSAAVDCLNNGVPPTYFGNIDVKKSSNVHFGNTAIYNGDVTVQQFVTSANLPPTGTASLENKPSTTQQTSILPITDVTTSSSRSPKYHPHLAQQLSIIVTNSEDESSGGSDRKKRRRRLFALGGGACLLIAIVLIAVLGSLVSLGGNGFASAPPLTSRGDWDGYYKNVTKLNGSEGETYFYSRIDWLAQPVQGGTPLELPVPFVIISHSATNDCSNHSQCVLQMRKMQTFHIESKGWLDIGYNFVVGGDGGAYEGRGWDWMGAHSYGYNSKSIGICFIGTFITELPPAQQVKAAKLLIEEGVRLGKISTQYKLLAHRQVSATESPGAAFYAELQKWPHWVLAPT